MTLQQNHQITLLNNYENQLNRKKCIVPTPAAMICVCVYDEVRKLSVTQTVKYVSISLLKTD